MRVGLMIEGQEGVSWEEWLLLARACEESGVDGLFRSDHYLSVMGEPRRDSLSAGPRSCRLAARFADEYNTVFASVDECAERRARVDEACRSAGREPIAFSLMTGCVVGGDRRELEERAANVARRTGRSADELLSSDRTITGTVEEVIERLREYERVGVQRAYLQHLDHSDLDMVRLIGNEVAPSLE